MKLFIVGGTGVLGRRVIVKLVAQDHQVIALSRSQEKSQFLQKLGTKPVRGSIYDQQQMIELAKGCDGVLHLATSIPQKSRLKARDWQENNRLWTEGTESLIQVVVENEVHFYIQSSVLFGYGHRQGQWVDENIPISRPVPTVVKLSNGLQNAIEISVLNHEIIAQAIEVQKLPAIMLRFGFFYSYDSSTTKLMVDQIKKRRFPIIGNGDSYVNLIHVDDAANAVIKAIENYKSNLGKTFNICDDQPIQYKTLLNFIADQVGAKPPRHVYHFLAKLVAGAYTVNFVQSSVRCKNDLAKAALDWSPQYPTYQQGFPEELQKLVQLTNSLQFET